jgi:phosphatidylglycerophosphatase A
MPARKNFVKILSTFFYLGYFPFIPGTFASIFGVFLFYLIRESIFTQIAFILGLTAIGLLVAGEAEEIFKKKDSRRIVIDEVTGMLLSLLFIPYDLKLAVIAFFLFRILDTLKPYPAGAAQNLKAGLGVMGDDIVAGLYTNIILQVVLRLASFKAS